jgi:DNA-binding transcriptional ArsR family regulator
MSTDLHTVMDQRLVRALGHPMRQRILRILHERVSSPSEIAAELGERIGKVAYHVQILVENGAIELVETRPVRGATQHFYRPLMRPLLDEAQWTALPIPARRALTQHTLHQIVEHISEALPQGGFDAPKTHVTWTTLELDQEAYDALAERLSEVLDYAMALHAETLQRTTADPDAELRKTELAILHFDRNGSAVTSDDEPDDSEPQPASDAAR